MAKRRVDVIFVGPDAAQYSLMQRFIGGSDKLWAAVQWVREPEVLLGSPPPSSPTVYVFGEEVESLALGPLLAWLDQLIEVDG